MRKVKSYVYEMFQELPKSKRAKELKAEILSNMEERYQELAEQNREQEEIENQLIAEIGTAQEIRENMNLTSTKRQWVVIGLQLLILLIAIGYIRYVKINEHIFSSTFQAYPIVFASVFAYPIAIFFATVLALNRLNYFIRPKEIFLRKKWLRNVSLTASIILMVVYCLFVLHVFNFWGPMPYYLSVYFMARNLNIIAGVTAVLFYLGSKK